MNNLKPSLNSSFFLRAAVFCLAVFLLFSEEAQATGITVGNNNFNMSAGENAFFGQTSSTSPAGNFLLFERGAGNVVFRIDHLGNITTTGQVLGSNTLWLQSGSNIYASTTSWNVGIGTTAPNIKLHVNGSAKVTNVLRSGNYRHVLSSGFTSTAANGYLLNTTIPYDGVVNQGMHTIRVKGFSYGTNEPIDFIVNFYLYSSGFSTYNWTNFGAYDPGDVKLSYEGNFLKLWWSNKVYYPSFEVFTTSWIGAADTDSYFEGWTITDSVAPATNVVNVGYANAQPQGLKMGGVITLNGNWLSGDGGAEGVFVDSNGNVGIGLSSLGYKLDVNGNMRVSAGSALAGYFLSTADTQISLNSTDSWAGIHFNDGGAVNDNIYYNGTYGTFSIGGGGSSISGKKLHVEGGTSIGTSYRSFGVPTNGLVVEGNLGVGTTNPTVKLYVNGNNHVSTFKSSDSTTSGYVEGAYENDAGNRLIMGSIGSGYISADWASSTYIYNTGSGRDMYIKSQDRIDFFTGGTSLANRRLSILSDGKTGIGTTTPVATFSVQSGTDPAIRVNSRQIAGLPSTQTEPDQATSHKYVHDNFAPIGGTSKWGSGSNNIWNLNSGNVGIGTTDPGSKLHIESDPGTSVISDGAIFRVGGYGASGEVAGIGFNYYNAPIAEKEPVVIGVKGDTYSGFTDADFFVATRDGTTNTEPVERLYIKASGNVGIGTTNPVYKLTLNGSGTIGGFAGTLSNAYLNINDGSTGNLYIDPNEIYVGGGNFYLGTPGAYDIKIGTNGSEVMTIKSGGNVGIGTTTPSSKLALFDGDFEMSHNKSIKISSSSVNTTLLLGNYADGSGFTYGSSGGLKSASLAVEGDVKADRLCIEEDCKAAWSEIVTAGGGNQWTTSGNNIYNSNSGNVGIGATSPAQKLDVTGVITASTGYRVNNAAPSGQYLRGNGTNFVASAIQAGDIPTLNQNTTGYANTLYYEDNRTVSPSELTVRNLKFGFTSYTNNNSSPYADFIHMRSYGDSSGGSDNLLVFNKSAIGMRLYQQTFGSATAYETYKDVLMSDNSPAVNYLTKYTVAGNAVSVGKSSVYESGSGIGIGTSDPGAYKLNVAGTTYFNGNSTINGIATVNSGIEIATTGTRSLSYYGPIANGYFTRMEQTSTSGFGTYGQVTSDWALYNRFTGANTRGWIWQLGTTNIAALNGQGHLQIAGNLNSQGSGNNYFAGNVGIGITNPAANFQVSSQTGTSAFNVVELTENYGTMNHAILYLRGSAMTSSGYYLSAYDGTSGAYPFVVRGDSRVGIGTSTPVTKLHIFDAASGPILTMSGLDTNYRGLTIKNTAHAEQWFVGNNASNNFVIRRSGTTDHVTVTDGGNVGIGKNPDSKLDLNGTLRIAGYSSPASGAGVEIDYGAFGAGIGRLLAYDRDTSLRKDFVFDALNIRFASNNGAEVMRINSSGNVGIGFTNPSSNLEVKGTLIVSLTNAGDGLGTVKAGTFDPPYTIDGRKYATYLASMTGVKEETTGVIRLVENKKSGLYEQRLDLLNSPRGGDIWLFSRVTDIKNKGLKDVAVLLSPHFEGTAWYEKNEARGWITVYARPKTKSATFEVSYRLTAPRFDEGSFGNERPASDPVEGFNLDKLIK